MHARIRLAASALLLTFALTCAAARPDPIPPLGIAKADDLFERKHYAESADIYARILEAEQGDWHRAAERLVMCKLRLALYEEALEAAEDYIARTAGAPQQARAERLTGHLYMLLPHWGTRSGGEFHRGEHRQGIYLQSHTYDKKHAVAHMERARELYAELDSGDPAWHEERIGCTFDLAGMLSRFGIYDDEPYFWHRWWGQRDEFLAETAGEEDFDEGYSTWQWRRKRPIGLRVGTDGEPIWPREPHRYGPDLPDDEKILYLLGEARALDTTEERRHTALSYYRQAMLARKRFGMDRLNNYAALYHTGHGRPLQEELESHNPWELAHDEALALAGGRIRRVALPEHFDVLGLLRRVAEDYATSGVADQARYGAGLYCQSRQQYVQAVEQYEALAEVFPESKWAGQARSQIWRIREPQVQLSQSGVQLPGRPAALQLSHRNLERVHFVARKVDLPALMATLRAKARQETDETNAYMHMLRTWHHYLVDGRGDQAQRRLIAGHVGEEVARWAEPVPNDGSHRYAQAMLRTPLKEPGAYLLYAYVGEPPEAEARKTGTDLLGLGASRAVVVLTDLAFVEKPTETGNLYYVADAATGAPVPEARVSVLEAWQTRSLITRKHLWHVREVEQDVDADGLTLVERPADRHGQLHVLVSAPGGRMAWSEMSYWRGYRPSEMRQGTFAYVITDRPVYRPQQTVRYKAWLRRMREGIYQNAPHEEFGLVVYDPRGDEVLNVGKRTDEYGGLDGELMLGEEPPLGAYRIQVREGNRRLGGGTFRVEEYKKPEFEVTVEPDRTHAKLGETLTAVIRARYYFGAPVTDATVSYKVFREEYSQTYYFPGRWDWLYGPGYGRSWYGYEWLPWWGEVECCWAPPPWWWGYQPRSPVRELVKQGEGPIGPDGTLEVEIDTAPALRDHPDRDHRYVVEAEVRDASRRVIAGEGDVKVTRRAFYATVQTDRGYYRPGEEMAVTIRCLTPDSRPVQTEGLVTVSRIVYGGADNARIDEEELDRWPAETDERGLLTFRMRHERSDQLKIAFAAPDAWGGTVRGYGVAWIVGRDFDGRLYRFNDLELITDKHTYRPGETCHLMINTRRAGSHVLFADEVDSGALLSYRLLRLPTGHTVVDVPIEEGDAPNIFVEATTVADLRVHQQARRICVPPEQMVADLTVETDRAEYRPGERATISVAARAPDGGPADVQVALSAFDKSVLYIQEESAPPIAKYFHGRLRHHHPQMVTNLLEQFAAYGRVLRPFRRLAPLPPAWDGLWGPQVEDWAGITDEELDELRSRTPVGYGMREQMARGAVMEGVAAPMAEAEAPGLGGAADMAKAAEAPAPAFAEAEVRQEFADTALWVADATTGEDGETTLTVEMPENLTTWKVSAWAMGKDTRVGQGSTEAATTKDLLVRLQAPRFFLERDEVVVSANVHNYLGEAKTARVSLDVPPEHLALMDGHPQTVDVEVAADGERRVDWRVKVLKEGTAAVTVKALTDEESDAVRMTFPVLVHGMTVQDSYCGMMRPEPARAVHTVRLRVPERRRPELTRLEVQFAPTLVGAMLDALPYCLDYPYGCTEQTVSRFLPAVLTLKTLDAMGITLEDVRQIRGRMAEVRRIEKGEHRRIYADNPVFDTDELFTIIEKGLERIGDMQHGDGGWAWWKEGESSPYLTAYVLHALVSARECDVAVDEQMIRRGMEFLRTHEAAELRKEHWRPSATHAFAAYVLSMRGLRAEDCAERLYEGRDKLGLYGKALLSLALANLEDERGEIVLRNVLQHLETNRETGVAWLRTPQQGWWHWWNNDIETNAWCLRALARLDPQHEAAPMLVKWLLENRRNGYYWRSTRDTTLCVAAMSEFVVATGEGEADYALTLSLDGGTVTKTVRISRENFLTAPNSFVLEGAALSGGEHTLTISKDGPGALYWSAYLRYFTKEEQIPAAGLQLKLDRTYYLLRQIPFEVEVEGAEGQKLTERRLRYERAPLKDGDRVESGDVIQVELRVTSDNDYTFLVFEDMKPAGCEPTQVRSGGKGQEGFYSYMELRDEKVAFFADAIARGEHLLRYRLRAEVPGLFHALPAVVQAMYVPELRGNSAELALEIADR